MRKKLLASLAFILLFSTALKAQFFVGGSEPASTKWSQIETDTYKIIYVSGLDSLAREYARLLENTAAVIGNSTGFTPNQSYRSKMPVILRSNSSIANGLVSWTPRRMELQTIGDAYKPEAMPWEKSLVIHESRHSSQMQFAGAKPFRWGKIVSGELLAGALAAVYPGSTFLEGDAVVIETALSKSGRGRSADFLEYYRSSFAYDMHRDYYQWRYGSQRRYTPDNYRVGYITVAGARTLYDRADFGVRFYDRIVEKNGVALGNFRKTVAEVADKKFDEAFQEICDSLQLSWEENDRQRGPFIEGRQETDFEKRFVEFSNIEKADDSFYASRKGLTVSKELVRIDKDGKITSLGKMSEQASKPRYSALDGNLYWSETRMHPRWENVSYSDIHYRNQLGKTIRLTEKQRYFNPVPSPDKEMLALVEYTLDGKANVVVISSTNGECLMKYPAPEGLRPVETVWIGDDIYMSGISEEGFGIWKADNHECLLSPQAVTIQQLWEHEGKILFTCDRTTVNELYALDIHEASLTQLSSTKLGAKDFQFNEDGSLLYYTVLLPEGRMIHSIESSELLNKAVDYKELSEFPMAEELSRSEKAQIDFEKDVEISEVRNYSKFAHLFDIHSWLPVYVDYDSIASLSMSEISTGLGLGATLFLQNELGDTYGSLGYSATSGFSEWRNSGHLKITHTSLLPVLELDMSYNTRNSIDYLFGKNNEGEYVLSTKFSAEPLLNAKLSAYVPLNLSSNGVSKGIIPQASITLNNDRINTSQSSGLMTRLNLSLRAYIMESIPSSRIYPRLGIGAEIGYGSRPLSNRMFTPNLYAYMYAYLPGFWQTHGTKFSFLYEGQLEQAMLCEALSNTVPRGFRSSITTTLSTLESKIKLSLDYAMPIAAVDWSFLSPVAYIRNFELIPHADLSLFPINSGFGSLYSLGADFCARLGNFFIFPFDTRIGVSYNYNGGSLYNAIASMGERVNRHSWDLIFTMDF